MNKNILLLLLAGVCPLFAFSQGSVGLRAGALCSSYWSVEIPDAGNRLLTGPQFGLAGEYLLGQRFGLRAEMNFASKGDAWYFDYENGEREEIRDVFRYIEIPLLVRFTFGTHLVRPYASGGFYAARAFSNRYTEDGKRYKVDYPKGDFGLQAGVGATMPLGLGHLLLEIRIGQGLKQLDIFGDGTPTRMRSVGISAGWLLDLGSARIQ